MGIEGLDKIMCIVQYWALFGVTKAFSKKEKQFESSEKHHLTNSSLRFNFHLNWVFLTAQFLRIEQLEPARNYHGAGGWYCRYLFASVYYSDAAAFPPSSSQRRTSVATIVVCRHPRRSSAATKDPCQGCQKILCLSSRR